MDEELKGIVQRMIDAGESEENIGLVIREYNKKKSQNNVVTTTTASPSEQEDTSTTLVTEEQKLDPPSDSSGIIIEEEETPVINIPKTEEKVKTEPKKAKFNNFLENKTNLKLTKEQQDQLNGNVIFTDYPGKEENSYYTTGGNWFRQLAGGDGSYKQISNEGSINALNNYYLKGNVKEANLLLRKESQIESDLSGNKIYTGLPDKEENEYKTNNGIWYRKTKESKNWQEVKGLGGIEYLNRYFITDDKAIEKQERKNNYANELKEIELDKEQKLQKRKEFFNPIKGLVAGSEEPLVQAINDNYTKYGINAVEQGIGDAIRVTSKFDEKGVLIDADNFFEDADKKGQFYLENYIFKNKVEPGSDRIDALQQHILDVNSEVDTKYVEEYNTILNDNINTFYENQKLSRLNIDNYENIISENKKIYGDKSALKIKIDKYKKIFNEKGSLTEKEREEYDDIIARYNKSYLTKEEQEGYKLAVQKYNNSIPTGQELAKLSGRIQLSAGMSLKNKIERDEDLGDTAGALGNSLLRGVEDVVKGTTYLGITAVDFLDFAVQSGVLNTKSFVSGDMKGFVEYLTTGYQDYEGRSDKRKEFIKNAKESITGFLVENVGAATTPEYIAGSERSNLVKTATGVAGSLPAMALTLVSGGVGSVAMVAQSFAEVADEMIDDPNFDKMPLVDMFTVGASIGVIQATLEKFGLSALVSKNALGKTFVNKIIKTALGKVTGKITPSAFSRLLAAETQSLVLNRTVKVLGSGIVEFETGTLQTVSSIGIKALYNSGESIFKFENPETIAEIGSATFEGGIWEGAGGLMMGGFGNSTALIRDGVRSNRIDATVLDAMHYMADDPSVRRSLVKRLKVQLLTGNITVEGANEVLANHRKVVKTLKAIPSETLNKTEAFDLLIERAKIQKTIEGKDASLIKNEKEKIDLINEKLGGLSKEDNFTDRQIAIAELEKEKANSEDKNITEEDIQKNIEKGKNKVLAVEETEATTRDAINKPSTLSEFGGVKFDSPLVGDTYVDGGQVVFEERETGKIYELGIAEDIMESSVPGLATEQERVTVTAKGEVSLDGNQFTIQEDLPTRGVEYDSNGDVLSVSLKDNTGKPTMIKGKDAIDIAYQIELQKIQTPEQEQLINEQLEKDEEFKKETEQLNKLKEAEDASKTEADKDIEETKPSGKYSEQEVDRVKNLPKESEDGATMNLDGSQYEGGGLVIPLASKNMDASELTQEAIDQFIEDNSESIGANNVKVGIYKFPNSNQVSIDLNIVADPSIREEALAIGKELGQESLFDLDTFENIKTGSDGKSPKTLTSKEFKDIQERLSKPKSKPKSISDSFKLKPIENTRTQKRKVLKQVERAKKALKRIAGNVVIQTHRDDASFKKATGEVSAGTYKRTNGVSTIHINLARANKRTVAHEVFHGLIYNGGINFEQAEAITSRMLVAVKKVASPELLKRLEKFSKQYPPNEQSEESIAELFGIVSEFYSDLDSKGKNAVKEWLDKLIKILNLDGIISKDLSILEASDAEVIEFLDTVAKKVATGQEIVEGDLNVFSKDSGDISGDVSRQQKAAIDIANLEDNMVNNTKIKLAAHLNTFSKEVLPPDSPREALISRFLSNIYEEAGHMLINKPTARDTGLTWYVEDMKEFEAKAKVLLPELKNENNKKLFLSILAITSSGTNPNQNLMYTYNLWNNSNNPLDFDFSKNWGERKQSFITKKGKSLGSGVVVNETKAKYTVALVDAMGNIIKDRKGNPKTVDVKKSSLRDGYPKSTGYTNRGKIVISQLEKLEALKNKLGSLDAVAKWLETPHSIAELREFNNSVPDVNGKGPGKTNKKYDPSKNAEGERNGAFIFGEKIGSFYQNMIGIGETITMDLWWSRTWNRYMGTMINTVDGKDAIQDTPRGDRERSIMREAVTTAANELGLEVSELQAVIWYFEQELWTKAGVSSPSYSYVTAANSLTNNLKLTDEQKGKLQGAEADLGKAEKRRKDAITRTGDVSVSKSSQKGEDTTRQQIIGENAELSDNVKKAKDDLKKAKDRLANHIKNKPNQLAFRRVLEENLKRSEKFLKIKEKQAKEKEGDEKTGKEVSLDVKKAKDDLKKAKDRLANHIKNKPNQLAFRRVLEENLKRSEKFLKIKEKQKDITRQQKFTPEEVYADAGLSESEVKIWKKENVDRVKYKMPYPEEALKANKDYRDKKISYEEKNEIIERKFPITPLESVPKLPTIKEVVLSLDSNKLKNGVIGLNKSIADGEIVSSRLDIPAYLNFGIYVDTIHGPKGKGVLGYGQTVVLTPSKESGKVTFDSKAKLALNVAVTEDLESKPKDPKDRVPGKEYKQPKSPFAVMEGAYKNESPESVVKRAEAALKSDEWVQVGFNPYRHAFFYDKANSRPVESATEVIQVGPLVMAKGVKYGKPLEFTDKSGGIVRFQKDNDPLLEGNRPTIDQIIERGNEINASESDLKKAFNDYGYSPKQVLENKQRKEGILPNRYSILRAASSFYKRWLSAKRFMPRSTFKAMEIMDASVASDKQDISKNIKDFDKLTKKYKGEERENLMSRFDAFVRGDKNVDLPEGLKKVATSMRLHIDSLSQNLINSGLVDADTAEKIKANMGEYLTRSYRVYDSNNWKDQVNDQVIQKAKNILRQQYGSISKGKNISLAEYEAGKEKISVEEALEILVDNRINDLLSKEGATNFVKGSNLGSKDLSILRERQDIPPEIMALMGVYKDPGINYAKTILKMSALAANHNFLSSVKKNGMGVFLFEKNSALRPKGTVEIFPKGSKTSNPLNGLYAPEAIAKEFRAEEKKLGDFLSFYMKVISIVKWTKTIGSVATHSKNITGNLGFMFINGHSMSEMREAYNVVRADLSEGSTKIGRASVKVLSLGARRTSKEIGKSLREKMSTYIRLGIVKQSAGLNEVKEMFKDANFDSAAENVFRSEKKGLLTKAKRKLVKLKSRIEDVYQAEDDFFKIVAFENEMSRYSDALFGKNKNDLNPEEFKEVSEYVAEIVKNTYPTYSRVPKIIKLIRRFPFIGNFISFQAEAYRTSFNTVALAAKEIKSSNPKIQVIGLRRTLGATTYLSAKTAILTYFSIAAGTGIAGIYGYLFNSDEEEEANKDYRTFVAPWSKKADLFKLSAKPGHIKYIDFSASDPHGGINKLVNAFLLGEGTLDSFKEGIIELITPFTGTDITTNALLSLKNNEDAYGRPIYKETDTIEEQALDISLFAWKIVQPGTWTSVVRISESDTPISETIAALTGFRVIDQDIAEQFGYKLKPFYKLLPETRFDYKNKMREWNNDTKGIIPESDVELEYKKANKKQKEIFDDVLKIYQSAVRLGASEEKLEALLKKYNFGKDRVTQIQEGVIDEMKRIE